MIHTHLEVIVTVTKVELENVNREEYRDIDRQPRRFI